MSIWNCTFSLFFSWLKIPHFSNKTFFSLRLSPLFRLWKFEGRPAIRSLGGKTFFCSNPLTGSNYLWLGRLPLQIDGRDHSPRRKWMNLSFFPAPKGLSYRPLLRGLSTLCSFRLEFLMSQTLLAGAVFIARFFSLADFFGAKIPLWLVRFRCFPLSFSSWSYLFCSSEGKQSGWSNLPPFMSQSARKMANIFGSGKKINSLVSCRGDKHWKCEKGDRPNIRK